MLMLPAPPPFSIYARNVVAKGPDATMRELDRLQSKIGEARRALSQLNSGCLLRAAAILDR